METEAGVFLVIYIVLAVVTYYIVKTLFMVNIDYSDREEREMAEDTKSISIACALVSAFWILYIPYMIIRVAFGKTELE